MSKWIGYAVSVNCGEPLGCYQGTILEADGNTITLTKAFRNGFPYPKCQVTLNAADIKELKIIETKPEPAEQTHSTVAVTKSKKGQRATVCENLQANPSNTVSSSVSTTIASSKVAGTRTSAQVPARSKPIDIQGARANKNHIQHAGSYGNASSTPKGRGGAGGGAGGGAVYDKARRRNEACFGDTADPALDNDFDFEGNLALFDKQALWEQMRNSHKPDLVRQTDDAVKFRHDENVLGGAAAEPGPRYAMRVPDELRGPVDYVTDDGIIVPSVVPQLRRQLWDGLESYGLLDFSYAMLARATADVALRLVGGGRRLAPRNAHQRPVAVALAASHRAGAAGLAAARLLASHGVQAAAVLAPEEAGAAAGAEGAAAALRAELSALALSAVPLVRSPAELPRPDVVVVALHDPQLLDAQERHGAWLAWAGSARAAVVALEPPTGGRGWEGLGARAAVLGVAATALPPALGRVHLADVAPPLRLFSRRRLAYRPPFGAESVLTLHPHAE